MKKAEYENAYVTRAWLSLIQEILNMPQKSMIFNAVLEFYWHQKSKYVDNFIFDVMIASDIIDSLYRIF